MGLSRSGGKLKSMMARIKQELLDEPGHTVGRDTLLMGLVLGLIWLLLLYFRPEYPWSNGKFLVAAVCFVFWGVADMLPRRLRSVAVILRVAVSIFLVGLGVWILTDLIGWVAGF